jgi:hypothetical protein
MVLLCSGLFADWVDAKNLAALAKDESAQREIVDPES